MVTTGCVILGVTLILGGVFSGRIDEQSSVKAQVASSVADEMLSCMPPVQVNSGCTRAPYDGVELFEETLYICDTDFEQSAGFETYDWGFTEGVMDDLELCVSQPSEGSNQSFFFMAKIFILWWPSDVECRAHVIRISRWPYNRQLESRFGQHLLTSYNLNRVL